MSSLTSESSPHSEQIELRPLVTLEVATDVAADAPGPKGTAGELTRLR
jgi:hypothetical protein